MIFVVFAVVITDPGMKNEKGYKPYDDGVSEDIFVKVIPIKILGHFVGLHTLNYTLRNVHQTSGMDSLT